MYIIHQEPSLHAPTLYLHVGEHYTTKGGAYMDCSGNKFCRSLTEADRARMCTGCTIRPYKKGQVVYREDIAPYTVVIVEGVMTTQTNFSDDMLAKGDCPCFFINTNGLVLGVDSLFNDEPIERYRYIHYTCLTDCTIARFDHDLVRTLFEESTSFAKALYLNLATAAGEACEFAAVLRANDVEQSVRYLLQYAVRKRFRMTQQQMADITGHSRVSVARALAAIEERHPQEWQRYIQMRDELSHK